MNRIWPDLKNFKQNSEMDHYYRQNQAVNMYVMRSNENIVNQLLRQEDYATFSGVVFELEREVVC